MVLLPSTKQAHSYHRIFHNKKGLWVFRYRLLKAELISDPFNNAPICMAKIPSMLKRFRGFQEGIEGALIPALPFPEEAEESLIWAWHLYRNDHVKTINLGNASTTRVIRRGHHVRVIGDYAILWLRRMYGHAEFKPVTLTP